VDRGEVRAGAGSRDRLRAAADDVAAGGTDPQVIPESKVQPVYPAEDRAARVEGDVLSQVEIRDDGTVGRVTVLQGIEGHPAFAQSAVDALRQWRFRPALVGGMPATVMANLTIRFKLD
jgi:periplasmic protein TonB